jgi:hypothetical protein
MRLMKFGMALFALLALSGHSTIITPAAAPEVDVHVAGRRQRAEKLLRAYAEEHAEELREQAEAAAALQKRKRECTRARGWLTQVAQASAIYRMGEDGNRMALDDTERARVLAKARADVARWCDGGSP